MRIRYALLTYMYTLFHEAHTSGSTVMRALSWEFPNDQSLRGVGTQFLLGPSLLITPVLEPNVDYVRGVFPGVAEGERWYDWYSLQRVEAGPGENVTLDAPMDFINVHVRGGAVLPLQGPGYTTGETRRNPYAILAVLDARGKASGSLYLDDGESVVQEATKMVKVSRLPHSTGQMKGFVDTVGLSSPTPTLRSQPQLRGLTSLLRRSRTSRSQAWTLSRRACR